MQVRFELDGDVLRVEVRERETPEETRELAERVFADRERTGVRSVLIIGRESRPIFKVEEYGLSHIFERIRAIPGLRVAVVSTEAGLQAAHEYIELLASQRGVPYRAFRLEAEAKTWLRSPR